MGQIHDRRVRHSPTLIIICHVNNFKFENLSRKLSILKTLSIQYSKSDM